jgi:sulfide:quinone oxidoreductase
MATVVILGAGTGGLVAANVLRRRLGGGHRVIVVDRARQYLYAPSLLWMMLGWREPGQITRDLRRLERRGIEVVTEEIREIDPARREVRTERGRIAGDYLIVALGAELRPEALPGLAQAGHNLYDLEGVLGLREAVAAVREGRVAVVIGGLPFKCPGAPYEAAMLIEAWLSDRGLRERVQVDLFTPEPLPMPVAGQALGEVVKTTLEGKGIGFHPLHKLEAVDPGRRELVFGSGARAGYDLLVAVPPHRCPDVVREAGLAGESGWVPVDGGTLRTAHERVFALGDVTAVKLPVGLMLPKAGVFAHHEAEVVARNVAAEISGTPPRARFTGDGY